ncbi:hypothetical protein DL764_008840 [Monosporascus ibericus]|uniref:F-box domain-containing protein n=1 Tax=Monosporascus ibericus TaxID=155417 RepID=A0A4Q4SZA5_9PEZI|nr:hypothetical protein DL764_008840 [Monosporascus ibericus]
MDGIFGYKPAKGAQSSNPFSKFPNEIILDISQELDPQDRATFAASSRLIDTVVGDKRFLDDVRGGESADARLAAKTGNVEILRRLQRLIKDFDWNVCPATNPNIEDVQLHDVDWVEPMDITAKGWTPLHIAAAFGNENIINYLWEQGIFIDNFDTSSLVEFTPLLYAAHAVHASYILPIPQDYGADIDLPVTSCRARHCLCSQRSRFKTALALLQAGANPMWNDTQGKNLLHICCKADNAGAGGLALYRLVKQLLARGVDATEQDHTGFAPVNYAVSKQHGDNHRTDPGDLCERFLPRDGSGRICTLLTAFGSTYHCSLEEMKSLIFEARESGNQGFERRLLHACPPKLEKEFFHWYDDHFRTQRDTLQEQRESPGPVWGVWGV